MKKLLLSFITLIIALTCFNYTAMAKEDINVVLDGKAIAFDVPPQIIDGRTMVPVRKIFEELGMTVDWFDEAQSVIAIKRGLVIAFPIGSTNASRNTVIQKIDVPAQLVNGRTMVPVRFVSEFTGALVSWDATTNTVYINSTDNIKYLDWNDKYEYWGEIENGLATGYGVLYKKEDGSLSQLGIYVNSKIVTGADFFDDGETFTGNYKNGRRAYGTYCYSNGDYYVGDFENGKKHGTGAYYYKDNSYYKGIWKNDLPNGYGILYDAFKDTEYEGNFVDGKKEGEFLIKDFFLNKTYYALYKNDVYIN